MPGLPMKFATKRLAGLWYTCAGVPICCTAAADMTTIRSPIAIASTWSCVT